MSDFWPALITAIGLVFVIEGAVYSLFPEGINVGIYQILSPTQLSLRVYERGVGETLACGTGVTAAGLITAKLHGYNSPISVRVLGGDNLGVTFETDSDSFKDVQLSGPADFVYTGRIEI